MFREAFLICVLGGCQLVFPLVDPDAPVDSPPGDRDNDGVLDPEDNCPDVRNADQHDEDGDLVGDVCDNCPHLENTSQDDDGDGDDLGAACDGDPTHDCIVHFDPFTSLPIVDKEMTVGTWRHGIDQDSYQALGATTDDGYLTVDPMLRANPLVIVGTRVTMLGPDNEFSTHGVWIGSQTFDNPGIPADSILAELANTITLPPVTTAAALHVTNGGGTQLLSPDTNMVVGSVGEIRIDLRGAGANVTGKLSNPSSPVAERMLTATGLIGPHRIGLRAHNQEVAFDYLLVVQRLDECQPRN